MFGHFLRFARIPIQAVERGVRVTAHNDGALSHSGSVHLLRIFGSVIAGKGHITEIFSARQAGGPAKVGAPLLAAGIVKQVRIGQGVGIQGQLAAVSGDHRPRDIGIAAGIDRHFFGTDDGRLPLDPFAVKRAGPGADSDIRSVAGIDGQAADLSGEEGRDVKTEAAAHAPGGRHAGTRVLKAGDVQVVPHFHAEVFRRKKGPLHIGVIARAYG